VAAETAEEREADLPDAVPGYPHPRAAGGLFGQAAAERRFLEAWRSGRLHHAWLLRGPAGVGKATLAYRIARALIAHPAGPGGSPGAGGAVPETLDPPPGCRVRGRVAAGSEPQLRVLRRTRNPKSGKLRNEIVVDDIRGLRDFFALSIPDGGRRVVIVDTADELNRSAANAFLKSLEEPPGGTVLLLVSHAPGGLLPTIRSRCRALDLPPLGPDDLSRALAGAGAEVGAEEAAALGALSGGSVGRALRLLAADGPALYARLLAMIAPGRVDRAAMTSLAAGLSGRDGGQRLAITGDLMGVLAARLARQGAGCPPEAEVAEDEAAVLARLAPGPEAARAWADAAARIAATVRDARAVNLDPAQTMVDISLDLDATLGRIAPGRRS
jgi:DNA polymerase-3 subunit delta'